MIKDAIKYVVELGRNAQEIITKEINGDTYIKDDAHRIPFDSQSRMKANTLCAVVDFVKDNLQYDTKKPYIINVQHGEVDVYTGLDERKNREYVLNVEPLLPRIRLDQWMDMEAFVIQLKTCFKETDILNNLVAIVSTITDESKVSFEDDGFGLKVTQISGTAIKKEDNLQINPIVRIAPYRTFAEVEQPESRFLLRVRDGGSLALYEADGGMWKLEAQSNVSQYLREALAKEIIDGNVVIIG